ncbi:MAG: arginine--tRNA ligase [Patescibacteria group bacterium]|nr:arginine--tRNA ligase [Patescibacteria group bacterium]MDE2172747.1 arginine--tRNA ligase [Patescibacteria group bacterium]
MKAEILERLKEIAQKLGLDEQGIRLAYPDNPAHGDFSTNIAMVGARKLGMSPQSLAGKIVAEFGRSMPPAVAKVFIAGPGFINFSVRDEAFARTVIRMRAPAALHSRSAARNSLARKIIIEYTDPNTFKVFHIGHLMSNAIGESLSRLIEYSGAETIRMCYTSDIGLHIAKAVWAIQKHRDEMPRDAAPIAERTDFLGKMYVEGTKAYEEDPAAKDDIEVLNRLLYERSSKDVNALYEKGRKWSLDHFDMLYARLGTKFDETLFESDMAPVGLSIVKEFLTKNVFQMSEGAVVFRGEDYGLHTRVFVNALGLPTYEAKEIGLNTSKFQSHPDLERSIIVTASEQNDYFRVLVKALSLIDQNVGAKTMHIGHGMMRFASGKMSSRTGNVVTAESLISDIKEMVKQKIADRKFEPEEATEISDAIAIGAIKYSILRTSIGSDIIFDSAASISFEGDSGPYLQYSVVRANSVLEKAHVTSNKSQGESHTSKVAGDMLDLVGDESGVSEIKLPDKVGSLEKLLSRFADVVERAQAEYAPQLVANYLVSLAGEFNSFYASQTIIDEHDPLSPYRVALTRAFTNVMTDGLWLLGITVPKRM